jgi:uncharacterized BrkB/YihY/UPF0761 family membrane protein
MSGRRAGRIRDLEVAATGRVARSRSQLEAARRNYVWVDRAFEAAERDARSGGGILAAALAFRIFLFLIPYVYIIVSSAGLAATASGTDPEKLARQAGIAGLAANAIKATTTGSTTTRIATFAVALFALFGASKATLKALRAVHALIWQIPLMKAKRPALAAVIFIGVVSVTLGLVRLIAGLRDLSLPAGLVATLLFVLIPAVGWLIVSERGLPHAEAAARSDLWPGAILVGVGTQLLHILTVFWVVHLFESKSATYGAIGTSVALLTWAYALGRLLTASAVMNASLWYRDHPHPTQSTRGTSDSSSDPPSTTTAEP